MSKYISILILLSFILLIRCEEEKVDKPVFGNLVSNTICKNLYFYSEKSTTDRNISCIRYLYVLSTRTLRITHENAGFNCCPGNLSAKVTVEGNTITIAEEEEIAGCNCLCLYDLEIELYNVNPELYLIKIEELYINDHEPLLGSIDLGDSTTGSFCVTREFYPWGE